MNEASRIIISKKDTILLGNRSQGIESGKWSIFGGKPKDGETPEQTALREVFEETGLQFATATFLFTDLFNGWKTHYFAANLADQSLRELTEHSEVEFFTREQIEAMQNKIAFNHYLILIKYFEL